MRLYSYIVKYDSGFAPNPFYGVCTLATCKPKIREKAQIGDWVIGTGSGSQATGLGGHLVYAMKVEETLPFQRYFKDPRFQCKKPDLRGSRKLARGDNIYCLDNKRWRQLNSYHSHEDGSPNQKHIEKDTKVDRVLISRNYIYFGRCAPEIPEVFVSRGLEKSICHTGRNHRVFDSSKRSDAALIAEFEDWFCQLGDTGYVADPSDWSD